MIRPATGVYESRTLYIMVAYKWFFTHVVGVSIGGEPACYIVEKHLSRFIEGQVSSVYQFGCCDHDSVPRIPEMLS